ncbi:MAG: ABC transporter permease subunit [Verrucomicrobiota bacterium]
MRNIRIIFKRELKSYFNNPLAYILIIMFSLFSTGLTFVIGDYLKQNDASLTNFFFFHPWIYMIFGPAIGMRLWSEEHRMGTTELLLTMPVSAWQAIVGKFLAACVVLAAALIGTLPIVFTVYTLGSPDGAMIISGYLGSFLVGAATIAITCAISAVTRNQISCLLVAVGICLLLVLAGFPRVTEFLQPNFPALAKIGNSISFWWHQTEMGRGLVRFQSLAYLLSLTGYSLYLTGIIIRTKRS